MNAGTVLLEKFESQLLKNNPLNDPFVRDLAVYLPPSYSSGREDYPLVVCLSGFTGSARSWFNFQAWVPAIDQRMDRLVAGGVGEMILVFPDCFTRLGGSQYLDSPAIGPYRSYLVNEILPYVEAKFRTRRNRRYRGVMGKSSGGYGAITVAMEHSDLFSATACHSGDMYFEFAYFPDFPPASRALRRLGGIPGFFEKFDEMKKAGREEHALINTIAMSACYSPNPAMPHLLDLPFNEETGELRPDIWSKWKEKDPIEMIRKHASALRNLGLIYLDCGTRDEFGLDIGARIFSAELQKRGIAHRHEEFEDGHFNLQYRYDVSLTAFGEYFNAD